jgi:hypothetical protein
MPCSVLDQVGKKHGFSPVKKRLAVQGDGIHPGAQAERRSDAGPVRWCLAAEASPAACFQLQSHAVVVGQSSDRALTKREVTEQVVIAGGGEVAEDGRQRRCIQAHDSARGEIGTATLAEAGQAARAGDAAGRWFVLMVPLVTVSVDWPSL